MKCIHRQDCKDEKEHNKKTQNDLWWLGVFTGIGIGYIMCAIIAFCVFFI